MPVGKSKETRGHIVGFRDEISNAASKSKETFFTWFDQAASSEAAFLRGAWDFSLHIALPLAPYISNPENLTCLEIGHGGGRLLHAASRFFGKVHGVDVHDQNALVQQELGQRGVQNVDLHQSDGASISLPDSSVDVVFSFIVLQHLEKMEILRNYVKETFRVLKPGGLALLYFGRKAIWSLNSKNRLLYWLDCIAENFSLPNGYEEIPARVNETNLMLTRRFAKRLAEAAGFRFLEYGVSYKHVPDRYPRFGGQYSILIRKD